jgi:acetyl-CoA carboxylase biotin carboxyl carrier protein
MTQRYSDHCGRERDGKVANEFSAADPAIRTEELGELLDRVLHNAVLFLSQAPGLPRALRVRAGEVSVDVEWAQEHVVTALGGAQPAVAPPVAPVAEPVTEADPTVHYLTSPAVGVFYRAPEPGSASFVAEGDMVVPGQQVGLIEAMKLMIPVEADKAGQVAEVLKDNGEPVEYGERLFAFVAVDGTSRAEQSCSARF